jgi:hypothetical protein
MAGLVQDKPGHPRSAVSKTRPTSPRSVAKAYRTRLSGGVPRLWSFVARKPRGWPGQARRRRPSQFRVPHDRKNRDTERRLLVGGVRMARGLPAAISGEPAAGNIMRPAAPESPRRDSPTTLRGDDSETQPGLSARGSAAKPGFLSRPFRLWLALLRQLPPMVAVAAQIVHFLPQRVAVRLHFGEVLSQFKDLSLQHGELEAQFVSRRFHCGVPNSWYAAGAASDRRLHRRGPG